MTLSEFLKKFRLVARRQAGYWSSHTHSGDFKIRNSECQCPIEAVFASMRMEVRSIGVFQQGSAIGLSDQDVRDIIYAADGYQSPLTPKLLKAAGLEK